MALYLDEQTLPYLQRKFKTVTDTDFIGKRIQGMLEAEVRRLEGMEACEHIEAEYRGKKTCCGKCGAFFVPAQGETWTNALIKEKA